MEKQKEGYEHGKKVHSLTAHCLARGFSGGKKFLFRHKLKYCDTVNQNWMPINIIHIHLAFCSPINPILCWIFSVILTFNVCPLLKRKNHQTIMRNLEQTQQNTKANKDCAVLLKVLLPLNPHYSTKNILQPTTQGIMNHTKLRRN